MREHLYVVLTRAHPPLMCAPQTSKGTPHPDRHRTITKLPQQANCEQAEALAEGDEAAMRESLAILTRLEAEPLADRLRETRR
jgi:hypothetical protein